MTQSLLKNKKLSTYTIALFGILILILGCQHQKLDLPVIPEDSEQAPRAQYIQLNRKFDSASGYDFKQPADIYYGIDNFLYVADTDNNRIVMLDIGGTIQGYSQPIPHPEAITQNDSLQLLIINKTNKIYRIDLFRHNHIINQAPVEIVHEQATQPNKKYTGISVFQGFRYYVTVIDESVNPVQSQIYSFSAVNAWQGPLPLYTSGTGLFSALLPTSIISVREQYRDISARENTLAFIFTQTGFWEPANLFNYYKVQYITTTIFEGQEVLIPRTDLTGSPEEDYLYYYDKFYNPEDIALDYAGNMFVVDAGPPEDKLQETGKEPGFYRFGPTGLQLQAVVGYGSGDYQFKNPKGIAVSPSTELQIVYVADTGNNRILQFRLSTDL